MKRVLLGLSLACLLAVGPLSRVQGAWRGDVIYCANGTTLSPFGACISVLEFDFTRSIMGPSGQHLDDPADKVEHLHHARDMSGVTDVLFNARAIVMDDADSAIVLCARGWRDEAPQVWLVQVEYRADAPYAGDKGPMNAGGSRGDDPSAGGILTGRLQLPVGPEKGWSVPSPARRDLPEIGAAGMFGSDGVMDMARDSAGNLYIAGRNSRAGDGLVFKVPAKSPYPTLGCGLGQRIGEGRFGRPFPLIRKATGNSWFTGIAVDAVGRIYLVDRAASMLDVYDADGQAVLTYDLGKELHLAPEAVRIDPLYHGPGVRLVLNVLDTRTASPARLAVLKVDAAGKTVRLVKLLYDGLLREAGDMGLNAVDEVEVSPDGDILYIDARGENDARMALIAAEDYLKALAAPQYPSSRVNVVGADVLTSNPGQMRQFGRGAVFVPGPGQRRLARAADANDPRGVLSRAEAELARRSATQPAGVVPSPAGDGLLEVYATVVGATCATGAPIDEVRAICYEAINRAPDAPGVGDMIARLADTFEPGARMDFLRNLARQQATRLAGQLAARLLARDVTASALDAFHVQDEALLSPLPCVVQEASRALANYFPATSATDVRAYGNRAFDLVWFDHPAAQDTALAAMLLECGRPLLQMKQHAAVEGLCRTTCGAGVPEPFQCRGRQLLCQSRLAAGDPLGALAAASPGGWAERDSLLAALCSQKDAAALAESLEKSVDAVIEATKAYDANGPDRAGLFGRIAEASEGLGLWPVAAAGWRQVVLVRKATVRSVVDGGELGATFPAGSSDAQAAGFWKAHALLAMGQAEAAAGQLRRLSEADCLPLRSQALYDLARVRLQQGWIAEAQVRAARCRQELPEAKPVGDLLAQVALSAGQHEQMQQHYRRWAELRKAADESALPDAAVESLLALADVEMQLGCPRRAAGALEEALQRHGQSAHMPRVLGRLVEIYRDSLHDAARAEAYQQRLSGAAPGAGGEVRAK